MEPTPSSPTAYHGSLARLNLAELLSELHAPHAVLEARNRDCRSSQEIIEESRLRFQRLFHYAPVALLFVDAVGVVIEANQAAQELFRPRTTLLGNRLLSLIADVDRPAFLENFHKALAGADEVARECRCFQENRKPFYAICRMCRWPLWENGQTRVVASFNDVTSLRKTQAALIDSEARHRAILEAANDAILTTDDSEQILSVNPATERIFGYSPLELIGKPVSILFPSDEKEEGRETEADRIRRLFNDDERRPHDATHETVARKKNGEPVPVELSLGKVRLGSRHLLTILIRDISERKRLEAQYLQSQKMEAIGQLAAGVAHDFNNLLTIINGGCEFLLSSGTVTDGTARSLFDEIQKAGERAADLTRQLLAFSRKQIARPEPLGISDAIRHLDSIVRRMIGEHIELVTECPRENPVVRIDRTQFEQILINLIVNARDAIGPKGRILLQAKIGPAPIGFDVADPQLTGDCLHLILTDNGKGMDDATRRRLFEPFFTTKPAGKGTGLGLATVYGIVRQYGGRIEVDSILGAGTRFSIYLPLMPTTTVLNSRKTVDEKSLFGTETILLAEDEFAVRGLMNTLLREKGYRVLSGDDVFDVLRVASQEERIDLLITDVVMPHLSGREMADRIRPIHPDAKILFISGYTDDEIIRHGLEKSKLHLLQKPFGPQSLLESVRQVLDMKA